MGSPLEYFDLDIGFDTEYVADHPQAFESDNAILPAGTR